MIRLALSITNPWSTCWDPGWAWGGSLFKHKAWECQIYRANVLVELELDLTHRQDHAGFKLEFGLFSWCVSFNIYDTRHWNSDLECWEVARQEVVL